MAAIAGIAAINRKNQVNLMLDRMAHRGQAGRLVVQPGGVTLGIDWPESQSQAIHLMLEQNLAADQVSDGQFARAQAIGGTFALSRDALGVAPLYFGCTAENEFCFASEVKGLLAIQALHIQEMPPGHTYLNGVMAEYFHPTLPTRLEDQPPHQIASHLRQLLETTVQRYASKRKEFGAWLSGGLDSSVLTALARPLTSVLHTFVAGFPGASDLHYARIVADYLKTDHHEIIVTMDKLLPALPRVIYHLESFDALLVRSSLMNYLVAREAGNYVAAAFSGEGGDELFAGYEYLKELPVENLAEELIDITSRLHNTALQRVDRSAAAGGIIPYVAFLDPDLVLYALRIPVQLKLRAGVEKWILRQSMAGILPDEVLNRPKAKFWQGAGVQDHLEEYADRKISEHDFEKERRLPNGWTLNTREELLYYRIFRDLFGPLEDLDWMGRTKHAPKKANC